MGMEEQEMCYVCGQNREKESLKCFGAGTYRHEKCKPGSARWMKFRPDAPLNKYHRPPAIDHRLAVIEDQLSAVIAILATDQAPQILGPERNVIQLMPAIQAMQEKLRKGGEENVNKEKRKRLDARPLPGERRAPEVAV